MSFLGALAPTPQSSRCCVEMEGLGHHGTKMALFTFRAPRDPLCQSRHLEGYLFNAPFLLCQGHMWQ